MMIVDDDRQIIVYDEMTLDKFVNDEENIDINILKMLDEIHAMNMHK